MIRGHDLWTLTHTVFVTCYKAIWLSFFVSMSIVLLLLSYQMLVHLISYIVYVNISFNKFFQGSAAVKVTSMPNGTGLSPPPPGGTVKGYPLNFVIKGNSATQGTSTSVTGVTATPANINKGKNLIFNNMGSMHQSQFIVQPSSPMSPNMHQRGKSL